MNMFQIITCSCIFSIFDTGYSASTGTSSYRIITNLFQSHFVTSILFEMYSLIDMGILNLSLNHQILVMVNVSKEVEKEFY